jgi:hypothetical protein
VKPWKPRYVSGGSRRTGLLVEAVVLWVDAVLERVVKEARGPAVQRSLNGAQVVSGDRYAFAVHFRSILSFGPKSRRPRTAGVSTTGLEV